MRTCSHTVHSTKPTRWLAGAGVSLASLSLAALWVGTLRFDRLVQRDVATLLSASRSPGEGVITAEMLRDLPAPVQRYLTYTGIVGKPLLQTVYLEQRGAMRLSAQQPWIPLRARQFYSVQPPGFVWDGTLQLGPLPLARARDKYQDGRGNMLVTLSSLIPVVDARGAELDQAALMRYLSEMIWFPQALLGDNVSFEAVDDISARVILTDRRRSVSGLLTVDAVGRLTSFVGHRYRSVGSSYSLDTWWTPVVEYGELAGLRLPVRGKAIWKLAESDFEYIDVTITKLEFNTVPIGSPTAMRFSQASSES